MLSLITPTEAPTAERERSDAPRAFAEDLLWYDTRGLAAGDSVLARLGHTIYSGVVLYPDNAADILPQLPARMTRVLHARHDGELPETPGLVVASADPELLVRARARGFATCLRARVDDGPSLHGAIAEGARHDYLMVSFKDPTNIPLELGIATLQPTRTLLFKEITDPKNVEDAVVTLGVMEVGADGLVFSPRDHETLDAFLAKLAAKRAARISIEPATVLRTEPVGMGYRSCIDVATLFSTREGMIVGSTSQGGILCCPEVFYLPYMELRPFRVNAGAVHSYVYNASNKTDYMTELRAGSPVMIADLDGNVRRATVGRMKTEVRPLRLIEAEFEGGERVNVLLQDDWHVRIYSAEGKPLNITELKPGDRVLGHLAKPGRHVGIKVEEHIIES
ncbi:MAG TPA: 3-dehydroquinate synthase II [Thermoanaerobaculia bacterium]|jgi:3-dehydroquinate synthase II/3-amino-4-hydroxybenzoic acid synthase|nr:3-dehydroquinate synthase II [Thermoanaerobaculia bacterium]